MDVHQRTFLQPPTEGPAQRRLRRIEQRRVILPQRIRQVVERGGEIPRHPDYLGLSRHPAVIRAFTDAAAGGVGSGAAALVTGHTRQHQAAESTLANWKKTESAVLTGSGYVANLAAVQAVAAVGASTGVRFLVDKLAHASLIDAVRSVPSATCSFRIFPHNHLGKLQRLLAEAVAGQLQVVVTESVFSMDGDSADLSGIADLKERFDFILLLDEAHAGGVYGPAGAGYAAELGLESAVDLSVVTLSKAAGCVGGAVCASADWCDAVVNFGRPYIYSTSLPPAVAAAITASIRVMADEPQHQRRVRESAKIVRRRLAELGCEIPAGDSPIIPVILGSETATLAAAATLLTAGIRVGAVRPPTVARGASRLRITISATHTDAEIEKLIAAVGRVVQT